MEAGRIMAVSDATLAETLPQGLTKGGGQVRSVRAVDGFDRDRRTVNVCFSSEALVDRGGFYEVLDHSPGAIRAGRLDQGLAVLVNHNPDDHVGISENWTIGTDRRCRADLRFGQSARADEIFQDVSTGIRPMVSVRYVVHDWREDTAPDGRPVFFVTDWEPQEISIASIPADTLAGVGRTVAQVATFKETGNMSENNQAAAAVDVAALQNDWREAEKARTKEIMAVRTRHGLHELCDKALSTGQPLDDFRRDVLQAMGSITPVTTTPEIGLTPKETKRYSFVRAINALANPGSRAAREAAGFEYEVSDAAQKVQGRASEGILVPHDVLISNQRGQVVNERGMTVGTAADGGYLKFTDNGGVSFIDVLRNKMMVLQMGATEMTGLVGDVAVPRMTAGTTGYWVNESTAVTASVPTLGQMTFAPKICGALTEISRKLLVQSTPAADAMIQNDLALTVALTVDKSVLHGGGTSDITGLASLIGASVAVGADGGPPTYALMVSFESLLGAGNGDNGAVGWLINPKLRGKLRQLFAVNATYGTEAIYTNGQNGFGDILGYKCGVTNQVSSTLTKGSGAGVGVCSAAFFGSWDAVVVGMWGGLDLTVDPYSLSDKGWIRVVALQLVDANIRQTACMKTCLDFTTT